MRHRGAFLITIFVLAVGALVFRLPALGNRPFHGDEAVHAFKFLELFHHGVYRYDPNEFHGPTLYYAALPLAWLQGRHNFADFNEQDFRLPIALCGAAMALAIAPLASGLGKRAIVFAAALTAISPALVFYSRYYIQETLLALFTLLTIAFGWQYLQQRRTHWLLLAGATAGLMIASKETAVLAFAAAGLAALVTPWWTRLVDSSKKTTRLRRKAKGISFAAGIALAAGTAVLVAGLFVSGFLSNHDGPLGLLTGPVDYLRAYLPWLSRARGASQHVYPWHYYLGLLVWTKRESGPVYSEAIIVVLALAGFVMAMLPRRISPFRGSRMLARLLANYTLILTLLYSAIPYKTPWCLLSFLNGMILLAGIGASGLFAMLSRQRRRPRSLPTPTRTGLPLARAALAVILIALTIQLGFQSYRASYKAFVDPHNPYVYAQPVPDVENMGHWVWDVAHYSGSGPRMVIKVIWIDDYHWPVAWYLREFVTAQNLQGFYHDTSDPDAPLVLASPEFEDDLTKKLGKTHIMVKFFGIRPGVFAQAWVRMDVWERYLKMRPKPVETD